MRRSIVALFVLTIAGALGAIAYTSYATDQEYSRLVARGDQAAAEDQPFLALEAYSGAVALRPDSMLAHLKRGRVYRQRGELDSAARDLRRATELDATATLPLELLGDTYLSMRRYDRAAERYQHYLTLDDRSTGVWYKLGLALYRGGQSARAIAPLQRAISLDASTAEAHFVLGLCFRQQGEVTRARGTLETAARLAPALSGPREALADLYAEAGDSSRAIDQLEALAALDPAAANRVVALGVAHARARRHEAAVVTLSRAVERFPDNPHVYGALGRVWLDVSEARNDDVSLKKALEALTTAATHSDVTSETLSDLGRALMMTGDDDGAERAFRQATERLPVHADAFVQLATVSARGNRFQEARLALLRYAALIGDSKPVAPVATQIATYSLRLGDAQTATTWIDKAVDEAGETPALAALRARAVTLSRAPRPPLN